MQGPKFKFEWNINTIVTLLTLLGIVAGGGAAWSDVKSTLAAQQRDIDAYVIVQSNQGVTLQEVPLLKQQIVQIERQFYDISLSAKETREVMNKVATQVEVMSQIMRRIEEAQRPRSGTN